MTDVIGPGSLKIVRGSSPRRSLGDVLHGALRDRAGDSDVRLFDHATLLVHTAAAPEVVRDWLVPLLAEGESVFVVEFERWSGFGPAIDNRWLARRGH